MISLNIQEVKIFMSKLLANTTFDLFIVKELELQTFTGFTINGQLNEAFYTKEELEERAEPKAILWSEVRQVVFSMIKGNKTPLSLKVIFQLPRGQCESLLEQLGGKYRMEEIGGLFLNVRFDRGELRIITGTAIKTFTMDKSLEQEWDSKVKSLLKEQSIVFDEE